MRHAIRNMLVYVAVALTSPLWIPTLLLAAAGSNDNFFLACSEFLSLFPGLAGVFLRRGYYLMCLEEFAIDCTIEFGTWLAHRRIDIGRCVYIGGRCTLGMCSIGDNVLIGSNVDIIAGRYTHNFSDADKPICDQSGNLEKITIGQNTWIGNSSVIMADVGDGTVIGAGSVVVSPIPANVVAVGNPCSVKKTRCAGNDA
jgi:virginiamycin A acetyltransferase